MAELPTNPDMELFKPRVEALNKRLLAEALNVIGLPQRWLE
jgi:hypothetical protein